jgi:2-oxo-3-(phosphooxy)propyl 3-oxoalkanoate synthase
MTAVKDQTEILRDILGISGKSRRLVDERLRLFDRIPFVTDELRESHIQLLPDDPVPEKIDPTLIRKSTQENCLLSAPVKVGDVLYFNILKDTSEIRIDHDSDHFVGLFILEAVRQIGMAMSHELADIPLDTRMSLQEFSLTFYNYIELDYPIVARAVGTLSLNQDLRADHTAFIDVRQNGVTCLAGTSSGRLFDTEERYQRIRSKTRLMNERYADEFERSVREAEEAA